MVEALNPRSCPMMGSAKACTSQQADSSQFDSSNRFMPGAASKLHALPRVPAEADACARGMRGTWRALHQVSAMSGNMRA